MIIYETATGRAALGPAVFLICGKASFYYKKIVDEGEIKLINRLKELADKHPGFGLRTLHEIAKREYLVVNHKRTERIYKEGKLSLRLKKKNKRARDSQRVFLGFVFSASSSFIFLSSISITPLYFF